MLLSVATAATLTVGPNQDYAAIQDAIDASADGDLIEVAPGTYEEAIDFDGKDIEVVGTGGSSATTLDGDGAATFAVTLSSGESSLALLQGFTLDNVTGYQALYVANGDPRFEDLVIAEFDLQTTAPVVVEQSGATFTDCVFSTNESAYGAGHLHVIDPQDALFEDCTFEDGFSQSGNGSIEVESDCSSPGSVSFSGGLLQGIEDAVHADFSAYCTNVSFETMTVTNVEEGVSFSNPQGGAIWTDTDSIWSDNEGTSFSLYDKYGDTHVLDGVTFQDGVAAVDILGDQNGGPTVEFNDVVVTRMTGSALDTTPVSVDRYAVLEWTGGELTDSVALYQAPLYAFSGLIVDDVTFSDNAGLHAGAIYAGSATTLSNSTFSANESDGDGGAVLAYGGTLDIDGCSFSSNVAEDMGGAVHFTGDALTITDSDFDANDAYQALAVFASDSLTSIDIDGCSFTNHQGSLTAQLRADDTTFTDTRVEDNGWFNEAIQLRAEDTWLVQGCTFIDNVSSYDGALNAEGTSGQLLDSTFTGNIGTDDGGGVSVYGATLVEDNRFEDNTADRGGGLYGDVDLATGNRFCSNTARAGGGFYGTSNGELEGNVFVANEADHGSGFAGGASIEVWNNDFLTGTSDEGAVYIVGGNSEVQNNTFSWNTGPAVYATSNGATGLTVWFNNFHDNTADGAGFADVVYEGDDDNIDVDPGFTDWTGDCDADLRLSSSSSLVNEGNPARSDVDGSRSDIGAWGGPNPYITDADGDGFSDEVDCDDADPNAWPGGPETWYDGVDGDCAGDNDHDADLDGFEGNGGPDCDDTDPDINPDAEDAWYDGEDTDCDGRSDFDKDRDGHDSDAYEGDDCNDSDSSINPSEAETWYDGEDSDCAGDNDYDADVDGYDVDVDCDDADPAIHPDAAEVLDDGIDQDCDGEDEVTLQDTGDEGPSPEPQPDDKRCGVTLLGPWWLAFFALVGWRAR
jgi:hypothetical protein